MYLLVRIIKFSVPQLLFSEHLIQLLRGSLFENRPTSLVLTDQCTWVRMNESTQSSEHGDETLSIRPLLSWLFSEEVYTNFADFSPSVGSTLFVHAGAAAVTVSFAIKQTPVCLKGVNSKLKLPCSPTAAHRSPPNSTAFFTRTYPSLHAPWHGFSPQSPRDKWEKEATNP